MILVILQELTSFLFDAASRGKGEIASALIEMKADVNASHYCYVRTITTFFLLSN